MTSTPEISTLTPVLTDNWDADRSWTLASYEQHDGTPRCAPRSA